MYGARRTNNHRKKTVRQFFLFFFLARYLSPTFLNTWAKMKTSRNLESKTSWNISGNVCMKGQAHSSSELALEKKRKKKPDAFDEQRFVMIFYTNLGVAVILRSFGLVPEGKAGKEIQARIWTLCASDSRTHPLFQKIIKNLFGLKRSKRIWPFVEIWCPFHSFIYYYNLPLTFISLENVFWRSVMRVFKVLLR